MRPMKIVIGGVLAVAAASVCVVVAALAFIYSGFYDVTAAIPHTRLVGWALHQVYQSAMERDSAAVITPADLETAANVQNGARLYSENCAMCHSAPGEPLSPLGRGIYPSAPLLLAITRKNHPNQMFWVIKNGIKMTGMADFGKTLTDQQIWDLAAFLHKDRGIAFSNYAELAAK
jgi:mono/diheme cytochrome c family protein